VAFYLPVLKIIVLQWTKLLRAQRKDRTFRPPPFFQNQSINFKNFGGTNVHTGIRTVRMNFHLPIHNLTPPPDQVKVNTGLGPRHFRLKPFSNPLFPKLYRIIEPSIYCLIRCWICQ